MNLHWMLTRLTSHPLIQDSIPLRVLAIAQAFKETLDLTTVGAALSSGIVAAGGEPSVLGASDGGDGLLQALQPRLQRLRRHDVCGPFGERIEAEVGWLNPTTAV